jgi:tellurium resistance protein TerD
MSINVEKGERKDVTKGTGIKNLKIGLGWDISKNSTSIDLDSMAIGLDSNGKCASKDDFIYFGKLTHPSGAIVHAGDNLTGKGDGDDEVITILLEKVPASIEKIIFAVSIYKAGDRKQNFGMVSKAFIRLVNIDDNVEIVKYDLTEDYSTFTTVVLGEIYRNNGEWKFTAVGEGKKVEIGAMAQLYGL